MEFLTRFASRRSTREAAHSILQTDCYKMDDHTWRQRADNVFVYFLDQKGVPIIGHLKGSVLYE